MSAQAAGGAEAVHFGHLNVHQDRVVAMAEWMGQHFFHDFMAVDCIVHRHVCLREHFAGHLPIEGVVFRQQDAFAGQCRRNFRGLKLRR